MGVGRSEGLHLGDIIRWAKEQTEGKMRDTGNTNFMSMGFLLELVLEKGFKIFGALMRKNRDSIKRPPEQELNGIYMSPDGLDVDTLEEYKLTWKSLARLTGTNPAKGDCGGDLVCWLRNFHWWWLVQIMSYCWVLGTRKARLIAFFVNGDYSFRGPYGGPQLVVVEMEFTEEELQDNWATVLGYRDRMLEEATA